MTQLSRLRKTTRSNILVCKIAKSQQIRVLRMNWKYRCGVNEVKLTADRKGNIRHFSAKLGRKERLDPKEMEILSAGAIPMLIPPATVQGRKNNIIQYDISDYSTLEFYLACILTREQFGDLLLKNIDVFQRMQQVYLNYKNLVLDFDKIYIQLHDRSIHFIYLPLVASKREATLQDYFHLLVTQAVRSTYEQSRFLDSCISWLNRPAPFVLSEFEWFVRENTCVESTVGSVRQPATQDSQGTSKGGRLIRPVSKKTGEKSANIDQLGHTVLLGDSVPAVPKEHYYLLRVQTEEEIELNRFPFMLGTEVGSVAYCITNNRAVSRHHAEFSLQDGACVIVDQNSTNKTYVNDCAISPLIPLPLKNGDRIRLGDEQFKFFVKE